MLAIKTAEEKPESRRLSQINALVIGAQGVGKTTLIQRFQKGEEYKEVKDAETIELQTTDIRFTEKPPYPAFQFRLHEYPGSERYVATTRDAISALKPSFDIVYVCVDSRQNLSAQNNGLQKRITELKSTAATTCLYFLVITNINSDFTESINPTIQDISSALHALGINIAATYTCDANTGKNVDFSFQDSLRLYWQRHGASIDSNQLPEPARISTRKKTNPTYGATHAQPAPEILHSAMPNTSIGPQNLDSDTISNPHTQPSRILTFFKSKKPWLGLFTAGLLFGATLPFLPIAIPFSVAFITSLVSSFLLGLIGAQALPKHAALFRPIERLFLEDSVHKNHALIVFWTAALFIAALSSCIFYMYAAPVTLTMTITTLAIAILTGTAFMSALHFFWNNKDALENENSNSEFGGHAKLLISASDSNEDDSDYQHAPINRPPRFGQNNATTFGSSTAAGSHTHTSTTATQPISGSIDELNLNSTAKRL